MARDGTMRTRAGPINHIRIFPAGSGLDIINPIRDLVTIEKNVAGELIVSPQALWFGGDAPQWPRQLEDPSRSVAMEVDGRSTDTRSLFVPRQGPL